MKTIFFDVDTQNDFMDKAKGALYVNGAEEIKPNLKMLTTYACQNSIPVLGSVDKHFGTEEYKHRESELKRWGGPFPDHCMVGTRGQKKIEQTRDVFHSEQDLECVVSLSYINNPLPGEPTTLRLWDTEDIRELTSETISGTIKEYVSKHTEKYTGYKESDGAVTPGIFFEKQQYDASTNPMFEPVLKSLGVTEAVVYGVATDYCVKGAVLALRKLGIEVYLVTDAIAAVSEEGGKSALEEMISAGVKPITTADVLRGET